jgi:hypothetical protein
MNLEEWAEEQLENWPDWDNRDLIFEFDLNTYQVVAVYGYFSWWRWRIEL